MKIKITAETKKIITLAQLPAVKELQKSLEEQENFKFEAESAACLAAGRSVPVIKIEAEIAKNCRIWIYFSESSEDIDVWLTIWAFDPCYGFYAIGAYLSDIWQIGPEERKAEIRDHMYIREYKEAK